MGAVVELAREGYRLPGRQRAVVADMARLLAAHPGLKSIGIGAEDYVEIRTRLQLAPGDMVRFQGRPVLLAIGF
jgi:H2-forming N5,N10-methylenetetrahydromethanopterin dehydrogenase-like enzyme